MAVFVYPWWATLLNLAVAAYLTIYLVRASHMGPFGPFPDPSTSAIRRA